MRSRLIRPNHFLDEVLGTVDPLVLHLYCGLSCLADRDGKLEDRPLKIKAQIFPYRQVNVEKLMGILIDSGRVVRYAVDGVAYIFIPRFPEEQHPHHTEVKSKIPDISHGCVLTVKTPLTNRATPSCSDTCSDTCPPYSPPKGDDDVFEKFWKAYPRKRGKDAARAAWEKRKLDPLLNTILAAVETQKQSADWMRDSGQYIPHPTTWLNQGRWQDSVDAEIAKPKTFAEMTDDERKADFERRKREEYSGWA